jgi:hypothetical protein
MHEVTIGQDMSCYATIKVPEDTPLTRESLGKIVEHVLSHAEWDGEEVMFDEDWSTTCATRVTSVKDEKGNTLVEDMAIDPSPYDAGQALQSWLRGYGPTLQAVINSAAKANLIDAPLMEVYRGIFKLPDTRVIDVHFEVRKGATREEKDLAFFEALTQIGTFDYVAIGEVHHGV